MTAPAAWSATLAAPVTEPPPLALLLLAVALLLADGRAGARLRPASGTSAAGPAEPVLLRPAWIAVACGALGAIGWAVGGGITGALIGAGIAGAGGWTVRRAGTQADDEGDAASLAGAWELLAVCLQAGLPVATAVVAAATPLPGGTGRHLRRVAGLLELGADPATAWRSVEHRQAIAAFARAAGRSAGTGSALAEVARAESARIRADLADTAEARAQRAAVLITGPLGLCFLPAFLVLGIAPVVIGLAGEALARW